MYGDVPFSYIVFFIYLPILLMIGGGFYFVISIFMDSTPMGISKVVLIKTLYLYLVSFVALMMMVVSAVDLLNILLKTYIFTKADNYSYYPAASICTPGATTTYDGKDCVTSEREARKSDEDNRVSNRQRDLVRDISLLAVGIPLFTFHWRLARKKD